MDLSKMTTTMQEAFAEAQQTAIRLNHPEIDIVHLWKALSERNDSLLNNVYEHLGIGKSALQHEINQLIDKKPQVTGAGVKGGQYLSSDVQNLINHADKERESFKDDYLSVEHFALALMDQKRNDVTIFLIQHGMTKQNLRTEI